MSAPVPDCLHCGACCAFSADWPAFIGEHDADDIPARYVDDERGTMRCEGNRCTALEGVIGDRVRCRVYAARPLVCREFAAGSPECLDVRETMRALLESAAAAALIPPSRSRP